MRYFSNGEITHGALDEIQASAFIASGYHEVEIKEAQKPESPVTEKPKRGRKSAK